MDSKENSIYLDNKTVESHVLNELKTPFIIGAEQVEPNDVWLPIGKEVVISIPIPEGYRRIQGEATRVKVSIDQHNVIPVIMKREYPVDLNFIDDSGNVINMDTSAEVYLVKLVGNLYYNAFVNNFEPIKTSSERTTTTFNAFGNILMNDEFGYLSDLSHLPDNIRERIRINISMSSGSLKDSEKVKAMEIQDTITVTMTVVVRLNQGPLT
jgi:hypothetical protein